MSNYYKVEISAENRKQADTILNALLEHKLVTGGQIIEAPARFWWKGEIIDMDYVTMWSFTIARHKQAIIDSVKATSVEEFPMVWFTPIDDNSELLDWIASTLD